MRRQPQRLASQTAQESRMGHIRDTETSNAGEAASDAYRGSNQQLKEGRTASMTTSMKTPAQRGPANRRKGLTAERDLCKWLRGNGFPHAERAVRTGFRVGDRVSADPGDVTGTPGIVWSVKDCAVEQIGKWFLELDEMGADYSHAYGGPLPVLVHKRRGHANPADWWAWLYLADLTFLSTRNEAERVRAYLVGIPVRMQLGAAIPLVRAAGYGDALEDVA